MKPLFPSSLDAPPTALGFRVGQKGVHNTRTMMLGDLEVLLGEVLPEAPPEAYAEAIIEENVLAKNTDSTRRYNARRLAELYGLDPALPLFRTFRWYWDRADAGRPLLAMLLALARDPILRMTAAPVLETPLGTRYDKQQVQAVLAAQTGDRFSETSIKKISRMTGSSWTQSGHFEGRYKKVRQRPRCTPVNAAYALLLGHLGGFRGALLFDTFWTEVLDASEHELHEQARAASRRGLLRYRNAGGIIEVDLSDVLTDEEQALALEQTRQHT